MNFEQLEHEYARLFRENARLQTALERIVDWPRLPLIVRTIAHNALNEETK